MTKLLVVDDEPNVHYSMRKCLETATLRVSSALTAGDGLESVRRDPPDAVILDVKLPDMSGLEAYAKIRQIDPRLPVVIITDHGTTETAIEAMKQGAFEYLLKPLDLRQLRDVVGRALELSRLRTSATLLETAVADELRGERIVGKSPAMQEVFKAVGRIAPQNVTVLILGESGTGKELIARAMYQHSRRNEQQFLSINCAAIPETLLESELFGHERGAFTGADRRRVGKFEQANGGTLFLDELADMTASTQAKVLRALQEQQFERIGGSETIHTDVRLIAATNKNLDELVAQGSFRQDLFYRLNVLMIHLPPLRERRDDIPLLLDYFIKRFSRELGKQIQTVSIEAQRLISQHDWPGNVRELQNAVKFAIVHATSEIISPQCLPDAVRKSPSPAPLAASPALIPAHDLPIAPLLRRLLASSRNDLYHQLHDAMDQVLLDEVLRHVNGNQVLAAERLGVSRNTLRAKMRALGMLGRSPTADAPDEPSS